ncbi:MAG TPA: hypothetical protein VES02_19005 [Dermatophilaceae bacterium]|nr:hypothetical protein [Dermatophilaceae bacterium]
MTDLLPLVEDRLGEVGVRLTVTTGGQALCRLDGHMASAKELEGRMAVLLELRRALRTDPQSDITGIADRWSADLERRQAAGDSVSWLAYLSGGLAEIEQLRQHS